MSFKYDIDGEDMTSARFAVIGIGLLIAALALFFVSIFALIQDPSDSARYIIEPPGSMNIKQGEYEIWNEPYGFYHGPLDVMVSDSQGNDIFEASTATVSITINNREYYQAGSINVEDQGNYTIWAEYPTTLYFTPVDYGLSATLGFASLIVAMVGGLFLLFALILAMRKKPEHPPGYQVLHYSPTDQEQFREPPQSPPRPGETHRCIFCGGQARYRPDKGRWYCDNCRNFVS